MYYSFTLTRADRLDDGPVKLAEIDDEMRDYFKAGPGDDWYNSWFTTFQVYFMMGKTWVQIENDLKFSFRMSNSLKFYEDNVKPIIDFLSERFIINYFPLTSSGSP